MSLQCVVNLTDMLNRQQGRHLDIVASADGASDKQQQQKKMIYRDRVVESKLLQKIVQWCRFEVSRKATGACCQCRSDVFNPNRRSCLKIRPFTSESVTLEACPDTY